MFMRLYQLFLACAMISSYTTKDDTTCTLKVSFPQEVFGNATSAELVLTVNGENGEEESGLYNLTSAGDGVMTGVWNLDGKEPVAAGMVWTQDPHVGFSFFIEPGVVTVNFSKDKGAIVSGTPLNDAYTAYYKECEETPYQKQDSLTEAYMQRYNDTPLFGMLFTSHPAVSFRADKTETERLWAMGGENGRKMKYAKSAYVRICHNDIANGEPLRDVEIPHATVDGEGTSIRLSDYIGKGQWVLVDFWASWCVGCRQAIPKVKEAYEKLKGENVLFISIAEWDRRPAALKAMQEENMPWLQLIDEKGVCGDTYMFNAIPRFMLFAPDGTLAEKDVERNNILSLLTEKLHGGK